MGGTAHRSDRCHRPGSSSLTDDAWSNPTGETRVIALMVTAIDRCRAPRHVVGAREEHEPVGPTAIAVMLIAYGAVSGRLRSTPVSQAMAFVALGHLAGNRVLDLVEADTANQFVRHLAEAASYGHRGLRSSGPTAGQPPLHALASGASNDPNLFPRPEPMRSHALSWVSWFDPPATRSRTRHVGRGVVAITPSRAVPPWTLSSRGATAGRSSARFEGLRSRVVR